MMSISWVDNRWRMNKILLGVVLLIAMSAACGEEPVDYRLPPGVRPVSQSIELRLDPGLPDYSGRVVIRVQVDETAERIGIYQVGLDMTSISLASAAERRELVSTVGVYDINWLADGAPIPAGDYDLTIAFSGRHSTDALAMYHVAFEGNDYIFTQFEAMYGRRAIPLFDEPAFKIPFELTIVAPEIHTVIANTPVARRSIDDGWQRVEFMPTKPIPSYLIAYAVGPLDRAPIEGMSVPGFVYTPQGHADEVGFIQRETPKIVKVLEDYMGLGYPYRKLDFIAVPEFAFGAMENPGLMTFRTDLLMIGDEAQGGIAVAALGVVAHEVAHSWFGDLVTMAWWDDLWLNEAFATWWTKYALKTAYPQFENELRLPQTSAFATDQRTTSTAIRRPVRNEREIFSNLGLNYSKGATVLRIIENYVGPEVWRKGVQNYLNDYAWGNATDVDFWSSISAAAGVDVFSIASAYFNQPGFPIIDIKADGKVSQQRYVTYGLQAPDLEWRIPLNIKYKQNGEVRETFYLLDDKTGVIDVPADAEWIMPDANGTGYFRWQTSPQQYLALVDDAGALNDIEKIAMLDNSSALLSAGRLSLGDYLYVINALMPDSHPLLLLSIVDKLRSIGVNFVDPSSEEQFGRFLDASLSERFATVGLESLADDSEAVLQMRPSLVRLLGEFGYDPAVREAAAKVASRYLAKPGAVDSGIGREALRITALADDGGLYEDYIAAYLGAESQRRKSAILFSVYFRNPDVVRRHLDFLISADVQAGDTLRGIGAYADILDDHTILYRWLEENLGTLEAKVPALNRPLLPQRLQGICNASNLRLMQAFFAARGDKYSESLSKAVESLQTCIDRREREYEALQAFLARYTG
jgi:aminopeptidase N